jgi:hypothetical protein
VELAEILQGRPTITPKRDNQTSQSGHCDGASKSSGSETNETEEGMLMDEDCRN